MDVRLTRQLRQTIEEAVSEKPEKNLPSPSNPSPQHASPQLAIIKNIVRHNDQAPALAADCLLGHLKAQHSQERLGALLVSDCLFRRSAAFRVKFAKEMDTIISLTTGVKMDQPLPPPQNFAKKLKEVSISVLEAWNTGFGDKLRPVALAYKFLENRLGLNAVEDCEAVETERIMEEERQRIRKVKVEGALKEIDDYEPEIKSNIKAMTKALLLLTGFSNEIVESKSDELSGGRNSREAAKDAAVQESQKSEEVDVFSEAFQANEDEDEEERMEYVVRDLGLGAAGYALDIDVSTEVDLKEREHAPLLSNLRDGLRLIRNKHSPLIDRWHSITKAQDAPNRLSSEWERRLSQVVESCTNELQDLLSKCERAGIDVERLSYIDEALAESSDSSDCEMEEVPLFDQDHPEREHGSTSVGTSSGAFEASASKQDEANALSDTTGAGGIFGHGSVGQEADFGYSRTGRKLKSGEVYSLNGPENASSKSAASKKKKGRKRKTKQSRLAPVVDGLFKRLLDKSKRLKEDRASQSRGLLLQTNGSNTLAHRRSRSNAFGISNKGLRD